MASVPEHLAPALVLAAGERVAVAEVKVIVKPKAGP